MFWRLLYSKSNLTVTFHMEKYPTLSVLAMIICHKFTSWNPFHPPWDVNCPFPFPSDQGGHDKTNCRPFILSTQGPVSQKTALTFGWVFSHQNRRPVAVAFWSKPALTDNLLGLTEASIKLIRCVHLSIFIFLFFCDTDVCLWYLTGSI